MPIIGSGKYRHDFQRDGAQRDRVQRDRATRPHGWNLCETGLPEPARTAGDGR